MGVGVKSREERGGWGRGGAGAARRSHQQVAGSTCQFGGLDRGENSRVARRQPPSQVGCEHFLINHKTANRCGSPGAPLPRPTPIPEGGGGRNKASAPRRVLRAEEPERGREGWGTPVRGRPRRGRREAAGLPLPSPVRSLSPAPTAAAQIPAPGLSFPRSKFTLFRVFPSLLEAQGNSAGRGHGGAPVAPGALPPRLGLRANHGARCRVSARGREREGRAGQGSGLSPPLLYLPPAGGVGRRGPWAQPGRSERLAS